MTKHTLERLLEDQARLKAQRREFLMLAKLLAAQFRVSHGDHLVPILGCGKERNNIEAIAYWLACHGHYIESAKTMEVDPLNQLHNELNKKLLQAEIEGGM